MNLEGEVVEYDQVGDCLLRSADDVSSVSLYLLNECFEKCVFQLLNTTARFLSQRTDFFDSKIDGEWENVMINNRASCVYMTNFF